MTHNDATLPDDLDTAHQQIRELAETLRQQVVLNQKLQHQLEQLLRQRYGKKGEKVDPDQLLLFAFEAVVIGGLGSLWGTLAGGILLGIAQQIGAQVNSADQILAGQLMFLVILVVMPQGLTGRRAAA